MKLLKIKKKSIWCFLLLTPFFEPQYFKTITAINNLYKFGMYVAVFYTFVRLVMKKKKPSSNVILIALLEGWMLLITIIKHGQINTAATYFLSIVGLACIIYLYSNKIEILIKCLLLHFELCIYVNLFTVYFLKSGLYMIETEAYTQSAIGYFLGWHHLFLVWEIPAILVAWLYRNMCHKNLRCYLLSAAIFISEIYFGGSTGLVGVSLMILLCMIPFIKKIVTPFKGIFIALIIFVIIIFVRSYGFLEPVIVDILNKDMTFTGRLVIWNNAINEIISKPIIGHGIIKQSDIAVLLGKSAGTHCHDQILQILFQGGLIAFAIFVALYVVCINNCRKLWKYKCAQVCIYAIITYTIIGITEMFEYALMYLVLMLPFYLKEYCVFEERTKQKKYILERKAHE